MSVLDAENAADSAAPPRMTSHQRAVLVLLLSSTFLLAADLPLLNVAIPVIGSGLGFAVGDLHWITTAFALTSAGFTLLFGRVADLYGRRLVFVGGIGLLVASSVLGAIAQSPSVLIAARVAQGIATAMATPAALALLTTSFPEGPLRARALGVNGTMISLGFTVGAVAGGLLTGLLSWRWSFLINVPIGLAIIAFSPVFLKESRSADRPRMDVPGAITVSAGLVALVYGVSRSPDLGWDSPLVLGCVLAGAVLLAAFYRIELRTETPLASVGILRRPSVRWGNLGGFALITMQTAVIFLVTLYLQEVHGYSALATGVAFSVLGVSAFLGGAFAPRVIGRYGNLRTLVAGLVLQLVGPLGVFLFTGGGGGIALVLAALTVGAFGHVMGVVAYMVTATDGLPDDEQGLATGLATMTQQVALAVGTPVLSAVASSRIHAVAADGEYADAVLSGVRLALGVDTLITVAAAALVWICLGRALRRA
ncbi:MFS transporter [Streptomyces sp. ISL-22]|uniref:MFS transporter n=1 Tax=Streptomyces curacoi TaxID=146536 RepID=A0A124GW38_9ACTN|nr:MULTISPECIES: MFS transporter [Streptomyces]KUM69497.1 MFS transporter [Streptomyces curacoi]MBT2423723.1 MFS transporter [Streptomyces sp. ISL-24]MBT2433847.1 MFS transporter [Streptomyces sp. ISL-22]